jgi:hypothetical protein
VIDIQSVGSQRTTWPDTGQLACVQQLKRGLATIGGPQPGRETHGAQPPPLRWPHTIGAHCLSRTETCQPEYTRAIKRTLILESLDARFRGFLSFVRDRLRGKRVTGQISRFGKPDSERKERQFARPLTTKLPSGHSPNQISRRFIKNQLRGSPSLKRTRLNLPETREPCNVKAMRSAVHFSSSYVP